MRARNGILVVVIAMAICILLNIGAYGIPAKAVADHLAESSEVMKREGTYPQVLGKKNGTLDNWTDSLILLTAGYDGEEGVLERVFANYHREIEGMDPREGFVHLQKYPEEGGRVGYARYWHGYVPFVKVLLLVTDYAGIRTINQIVQIALVLVFLLLLVKKKLKQYCIPYLVSWFMMMPLTLQMSLQNSDVFYVMMGSMICLLVMEKHIRYKIGYCGFFAVVGVVINWVDFLTYPVLTLMFPLTLTFLLNPAKNWKEGVQRVVLCAMSWGMGYGIMWALKWGMSTVILQRDVFKEALGSAQFRLSSGYGEHTWSRWDTIKRNFYFLKVPVYWLCVIASILVSLVNGRKALFSKIHIYSYNVIPCLLIMFMPFVWYCVMNNHSYIHAVFTHRAIAGTIFAGLCFAAQIATFKEMDDRETI